MALCCLYCRPHIALLNQLTMVSSFLPLNLTENWQALAQQRPSKFYFRFPFHPVLVHKTLTAFPRGIPSYYLSAASWDFLAPHLSFLYHLKASLLLWGLQKDCFRYCLQDYQGYVSDPCFFPVGLWFSLRTLWQCQLFHYLHQASAFLMPTALFRSFLWRLLSFSPHISSD